MLRLTAGLLLLLLGPIAARGEWEIKSTKQLPSPNESVVCRRTTLVEKETSAQATLHSVVLFAKTATLEVIDQPHSPRHNLAAVMTQNGALAGVNGGYFDPNGAPVGLLVSGGKTISPLRRAKLLSAVLFATREKIDIVRTSRFTMSKNIRAAVQCGPLLIERGTPVTGLNDSRVARRTFAAVDGNGHVAIGVCSAVSLARLSHILASPQALPEIKTTRALNLDGGSSSAFWFAGKERTISLPELKTVRDFLAIWPKENR